nr:immunoglobulin heavy chain junction region [Macaca mulatta]MOY23525.1 immunoglobulin heavy chain junction region [Macaca mulatta]
CAQVTHRKHLFW